VRPGLDGDRRPVVDLLDLLCDVGQEVVGPGGERLAIHERPAAGRQRDHAARDVAVQGRDDEAGALGLCELDDLRGRPDAVGEHEQDGSALERQLHGVRPVADHHDVALVDPRLGPHVHGEDPDAARDLQVVAGDELTLQDLDDRRHACGGVRQ
jgi:hypothetical protein